MSKYSALDNCEPNAPQIVPSNSSVSLVKSSSGWDPSVVIPLLYPNRPLSSSLLNPPSSTGSPSSPSESSLKTPPSFNPNQVAKAWMYKCSIPIMNNPSPEEFWNVAVQGEQPVVLRHVNNNAVFRRLTTRNNLLEMVLLFFSKVSR